jgi:tetratricopeptide (TPR) repeat protein
LILAIFLSLCVKPSQVNTIPDVFDLAEQGKLDEAVAYYRQLVHNDPNNLDVQYELAGAYVLQGNYDKAIEHCKKALQLRHDAPDLLNNTALALMNKADATLVDKRRAVEYAEQSCRLTGYLQLQPVVTLASAYVRTGQSDKAITTAQRAIELATFLGRTDVAENTQKWLQQYKQQIQSKSLSAEDNAKP